MISSPPKLGPPTSYIHAIWHTASDDEPVAYLDELDADRWSIRCIRKFANGATRAFSHDHPNWRDVMPEAAFPQTAAINADPQFTAREISREEFEIAWQQAISDTNRDA
jgi:hypothetical protein